MRLTHVPHDQFPDCLSTKRWQDVCVRGKLLPHVSAIAAQALISGARMRHRRSTASWIEDAPDKNGAGPAVEPHRSGPSPGHDPTAAERGSTRPCCKIICMELRSEYIRSNGALLERWQRHVTLPVTYKGRGQACPSFRHRATPPGHHNHCKSRSEFFCLFPDRVLLLGSSADVEPPD